MESAVRHPTDTIELIGLTKSFGDVHAVRDIDLSIRAGETVALLGPNGAGKSTTIDLILGLARPDAGTVSLFGVTPDEAVAAGTVAAMLQTGELIRHISVRELITMVASFYTAPLDVDDVLAITGLGALAGRRTNKLSGGEAQRVRFATAIVADPQLVILDEPTVGLDVETRRAFWTTIRRFTERGTTVLFATHFLDEADANADRIVMVAKGRIVADGSVTDIKTKVATRTIRATLENVEVGVLAELPGVRDAQRHGDSVLLVCHDADSALRALVGRYPDARDFEVRGGGLEDAFMLLTQDAADGTDRADSTRGDGGGGDDGGGAFDAFGASGPIRTHQAAPEPIGAVTPTEAAS